MHDANMCIKQYFFFNFFNNFKFQLVQLWWINSYSHNIPDDDAVKKVGFCSNSNSKVQNILYVKCNVKKWFL
jgi:hypothetical protein